VIKRLTPDATALSSIHRSNSGDYGRVNVKGAL
jgi:hypothetical protein